MLREKVSEFKFYEFLRDYHQKDNKHNPKTNVNGAEDIIVILDGQQRMTYPILGIRVEEAPEGEKVEEDKELLRMLYYKAEVADLIDTSSFAQNEYNLKHLHKKNLKWKSILSGISDGLFKEPYELSNSEKMENMKENIQYFESGLRQCREMLEGLESKEADTKEDSLTKNINKEYRQQCKDLEKNCSRLKETVDKLVGQAMEEIMK